MEWVVIILILVIIADVYATFRIIMFYNRWRGTIMANELSIVGLRNDNDFLDLRIEKVELEIERIKSEKDKGENNDNKTR